MNYITILNILGWIIASEGVMMLLPMACAALYREPTGLYFVPVAVACVAVGLLLTRIKAKNKRFYRPGGLCGGGPGLDCPAPAGRHSLHCRQRDPILPGRRVRDGLRLHHHRRHHSGRRRGPEPLYAVLARLHPVDRRHGGAGLSDDHPAPDGRRVQLLHDAGGEPGSQRIQAGSPPEGERPEAVQDLHRPDPGGVCPAAVRTDAGL